MFAAFELAELAGEFDALGFAAGENRRRVAELEVSESKLIQDADLAGDRRLIREELDAFLNRQIEDFGDVLALVLDLERVLVVTRPLAGRAEDFHVGHERKLRRDRPFAGTFLAAAAFDVEAEGRGREAALFGLVGFGEQRANRVIEADVSRRIGTR